MKDNKLRQGFEGEEQEKKTESVLTGRKVVSIVSIIGLMASGGLFGWGLYHHNSTQMVIFGILALVCAAGFIAKNVDKKQK